jgi:hypothetical protein
MPHADGGRAECICPLLNHMHFRKILAVGIAQISYTNLDIPRLVSMSSAEGGAVLGKGGPQHGSYIEFAQERDSAHRSDYDDN